MKVPAPILALALAAGVSASAERRGRHARVVFARGERSRFITISGTASDCRAIRNQVADSRRAIRELDV